jgi:hypothetical protein
MSRWVEKGWMLLAEICEIFGVISEQISSFWIRLADKCDARAQKTMGSHNGT